MATTETVAHPVEKVGTDTTRRSWKRGLIAGVVAVFLTLAAVAYVNYGEETTEAEVPTIDSETVSREDILRDLVNRRLIPSQALDPAPMSRDEIMRDLVNRGLIPSQALDPAPMSRDEILRDLVNRGLIPRQSLND